MPQTLENALTSEFPNQIIRASAGTGKTFALSNRYLRLLLSGQEPQTILATTFTKKGAGEILDRIIERLASAALDEDAASELAEQLEWKVTRSRAANVLHELLKNLHRLEVSTLDSFFNRIAQVFSLELNLPSTWQIVEQQEMNRLHDQATGIILSDDNIYDLLHLLSKGETSRTVATQVQDTVDDIYETFCESGPEPWDQLKPTGRFLSDELVEQLVSRLEAFQTDKKSLNGEIEKVVALAYEQNWIEFAQSTSVQNTINGDPKYYGPLPDEIVEVYQQLIPHCVAHAEQQLIQQNRATRDLMLAFSEAVERLKDARGTLRFSDITNRLKDFVETGHADQFAFRLDHHIQHLLLDEFQDTSLPQWTVVRPFARSVTEKHDVLRSFFCVGDLKQAIFGWRGGVAEIFDLVDDELDNLADPQSLTTSYRSSQIVIDLVNKIFDNLDQYACGDELAESAIKAFGERFLQHSTAKIDLAGYTSVEMAADKVPDDEEKPGTGVTIDEQVFKKTIERVSQLHRDLPDDKSIGVIVRTNREVNQLVFGLQQAEIPASEEGGNPITDSAAVELVLSALTLADQPDDSIARFHLSHSPLAEHFGFEPENDSNGLQNSAASNSGAARLREQLIQDGFGPTVEMLAKMLVRHTTRRELLRLQQLVQAAFEADGNRSFNPLRPGTFVKFVYEELRVADSSSARVRVLTIHKAKGLEFDAVVLPFLAGKSGWTRQTPNFVVGRPSPAAPIDIASRYAGKKLRRLLPKRFQQLIDDDNRRSASETMCVLYVALTRSAHATHIILPFGIKPNAKSPAGLLRSILCPNVEPEEGLLCESGDPQWYRVESKSGSQNTNDPDPFDLKQFYLDQPPSPRQGAISTSIRSGRGTPRISPSSIADREALKLDQILSTPDHEGIRHRGTLLHACFEQVQWLDESVPEKSQLESVLRSVASEGEDFHPVIDSFYEMIEQPNTRGLLSSESYQSQCLSQVPDTGSTLMDANRIEVETERRFAVSLPDGILQGVIDRLILVYAGNQLVAADVIDFKTDRFPPDALHKRIEVHRPQLNSYRSAAAKILDLPVEQISTRLLFLETDQLVNLDLRDEQAHISPKLPKSTTAKRARKNHQKRLF